MNVQSLGYHKKEKDIDEKFDPSFFHSSEITKQTHINTPHLKLIMLTTIKTVHTIIWAIMASASLYILYAGITNMFNTLLVISISLIMIETFILLINKWTCPLTPLARRYTTDDNPNFDIYLPNWLAKYNKIIFGIVFIIGIILVIFNLISG